MAPFLDPAMDQRKDQYFKQDRDPQLLYQGTQETIVKELKAWVVRRKEVIKEQMELRNKSQKSTKELISSAVKAADPGQMRIFLERNARAKMTRQTMTPREQHICSRPSSREASPGQSSGGNLMQTAAFNAMAEEGKGAGGGEIPTARRQPSGSPGNGSGGGGASSAGKPAVVKGAEDKLKRSLAATFASDDFYDGPVGGSGSKTSTQEKRAEAGKEAKGKAKDGSKQTKG